MSAEGKSSSLVQGTLHRRGTYYALTAQGRATLKRETKDWEQQSAAIGRIMSASLGEL